MRISTIKKRNEETAARDMPLKIKSVSLIKRLYNKIARNKEPDDMIVMELEAIGFKVYPPVRQA